MSNVNSAEDAGTRGFAKPLLHQHDDPWKAKYYALANKIYRQAAYYRGISARLRCRLETEGATPKEAVEAAAMISQVDKAAADMTYIWDRAIHGLSQTVVNEITTHHE